MGKNGNLPKPAQKVINDLENRGLIDGYSPAGGGHSKRGNPKNPVAQLLEDKLRIYCGADHGRVDVSIISSGGDLRGYLAKHYS